MLRISLNSNKKTMILCITNKCFILREIVSRVCLPEAEVTKKQKPASRRVKSPCHTEELTAAVQMDALMFVQPLCAQMTSHYQGK